MTVRSFRVALVTLLPALALVLGFDAAWAQSTPAPAVSATPAPSASPAAPATPAPAASASPARSATPAPAASATPAHPPAAETQAADPFGEPFTLEPKKVVIAKGSANWDAAFDALIESFKSLTAL